MMDALAQKLYAAYRAAFNVPPEQFDAAWADLSPMEQAAWVAVAVAASL